MKKIPPRGPGRSSARARVLAQWRGVDLTPLEKARASAAQSAEDVMANLMTDLKFDSRRFDIEIKKVWNTLVDPKIAAHAQPANLAKGTLYVSVDNDTLCYHINRFHRAEITKLLQASFGKEVIKKIFFRFG